MGKFFWYPDGSDDPWASWYDARDRKVQGRHDSVMRYLEAGHWREPNWKQLTDADGLSEVIIFGSVQHRLFGFRNSNGDFIVVLTCTHKGKQYKPKDAIATGITRMKAVKEGKSKVVECAKPIPKPKRS